MSDKDRADQIIEELSRCAPAQLAGNAILSLYLPADSLGKIFAYALDMRRQIETLQADLDKAKEEV